MTNGIARLRTMGIAKQTIFNVAATSATYVLPLTNAPQFNGVIQKAMNEAALGSAYIQNDMVKTVRMSDVPLEFKIDEDHLPLILNQRFNISSTTVSGDANAYEHIISFQNGTNNWYTLFMQDDQRKDYIVKNALFDNLDFTFDQDFVRVSASVVGNYPEISTVTNAVVQPKEFVGRMTVYSDIDAPGTVTSSNALSATLNMDFGINDDATKHDLGNQDLAALLLTADSYIANIVRRKPDTTYYEDHEDLVAKTFQIKTESTDRFITGTTVTRPLLQFDVPRGKMENYNEEPDLNELIRENFDLRFLDVVGVSDTPVKITVRNQVANY